MDLVAQHQIGARPFAIPNVLRNELRKDVVVVLQYKEVIGCLAPTMPDEKH